MEARLLHQSRSPFAAAPARRRRHEFPATRQPSILYTMTKPAGELETAQCTNIVTVYLDKWFDRLAINHLSQKVQDVSGLRSEKKGYDNLVDAARMASQNFNPVQQREIVQQALTRAFPAPILAMIKTLLPNSEFARQYFAIFTTVFFKWLVGPCEVRESELNGKTERNVVYIKKCRFLEEANCVGMCTNMCKMPSQAFIKDTLGIPLTMVPNFDDMSCEMIFGREPPTANEDPAFKQPCYKLCNIVKLPKGLARIVLANRRGTIKKDMERNDGGIKKYIPSIHTQIFVAGPTILITEVKRTLLDTALQNFYY